MMLETVAAVPGMVGGMLLHCKSLRRFEPSGGWIKALLEEAENERMHLMTFMEVSKPRWYERALVFTVQGVFFNAYFLAYLASPKLAHKIMGYLEKEVIYLYTEFLKELVKGTLQNMKATTIVIEASSCCVTFVIWYVSLLALDATSLPFWSLSSMRDVLALF